MTNQQLKLTFGEASQPTRWRRRSRRAVRAAWWFAQMHQTVDEAGDWPAAQPAETEHKKAA